MDRLDFTRSTIFLATAGTLALTGCDNAMNNMKQKSIVIPQFSRDKLHTQLDRLQDAFEEKGCHVSKNLLPAIQEQELKIRCGWFPAELPPELISLYAWRGGHADDDPEVPSFWFRDCIFSSPEWAEKEYKSMMGSYGACPEDHELLKYSFPFAAFNGGWLIFPCHGQKLDKRFEHPVISVMQGIDVHYYSMQLMVDTCVDWVSSMQYRPEYGLPEKVELEIWKKHNPGIFEK